MNNNGPIVLLENNPGDREIFMEIFSELEFSNQILYFNTAKDAYHHLISKGIQVFLIFSDIALLDIEEKQQLEITYKKLSMELNVPCLFFTTTFSQSFVLDLYSVPAQSYVIKPYDYEKFRQIIKTVINYWSKVKSLEDFKTDPFRRNNISDNLN